MMTTMVIIEFLSRLLFVDCVGSGLYFELDTLPDDAPSSGNQFNRLHFVRLTRRS